MMHLRAPRGAAEKIGPRRALGAQAERLGARQEARTSPPARRSVVMVLATYITVGAAAACLRVALGCAPDMSGGWLGMRGAAAFLASLGAGICIGAVTIAATRVAVRRAAWARALHAALRPAVHGAGDGLILVVAAASAIGEELLFRGLLVPLLGIVGSSAVFGALHQIQGRARWWWIAWAMGMGIVFAVVFRATGSLVGPIVAHAAINAANLRYLRDNDPTPRPRLLGGILRR
jgi:membrane protease YdiL (CAAX protease family)